MSKAITGDLSLDLGNGTVLRDTTDLGLAWQWAEHVCGPELWARMGSAERNASVADALAELRASVDN